MILGDFFGLRTGHVRNPEIYSPLHASARKSITGALLFVWGDKVGLTWGKMCRTWVKMGLTWGQMG